MNFIGFSLIVLTTFMISQFAMTQIIGILFIKLPQKNYSTIFGLIIWSIILYCYYLAITKWFYDYFNVYLWVSIISAIICILNLKNLKDE